MSRRPVASSVVVGTDPPAEVPGPPRLVTTAADSSVALPMAGRVVGIDPGLGVTGYAVLEPGQVVDRSRVGLNGQPYCRPGPVVVEAGVIRSSRGGMGKSLAARLAALHAGILDVLDSYPPQALALEQVHSHPRHPRTAILMAHARGVIVLAAQLRGVPVVGYSASRIKKTLTGSGRAPKEQMQHAVRIELGLVRPPEPHDVADACAVALCHYQTLKLKMLG